MTKDINAWSGDVGGFDNVDMVRRDVNVMGHPTIRTFGADLVTICTKRIYAVKTVESAAAI